MTENVDRPRSRLLALIGLPCLLVLLLPLSGCHIMLEAMFDGVVCGNVEDSYDSYCDYRPVRRCR